MPITRIVLHRETEVYAYQEDVFVGKFHLDAVELLYVSEKEGAG